VNFSRVKLIEVGCDLIQLVGVEVAVDVRGCVCLRQLLDRSIAPLVEVTAGSSGARPLMRRVKASTTTTPPQRQKRLRRHTEEQPGSTSSGVSLLLRNEPVGTPNPSGQRLTAGCLRNRCEHVGGKCSNRGGHQVGVPDSLFCATCHD